MNMDSTVSIKTLTFCKLNSKIGSVPPEITRSTVTFPNVPLLIFTSNLNLRKTEKIRIVSRPQTRLNNLLAGVLFLKITATEIIFFFDHFTVFTRFYVGLKKLRFEAHQDLARFNQFGFQTSTNTVLIIG